MTKRLMAKAKSNGRVKNTETIEPPQDEEGLMSPQMRQLILSFDAKERRKKPSVPRPNGRRRTDPLD
jgi:hypothetical protein